MLKNMKIGSKLAVSFGVLVFLLLVVSVVGVMRLSAVNGAIAEVANDKYPKVQKLMETQRRTLRYGQLMRDMIIIQDAGEMRKRREEMAEHAQANDEIYAELEKVVASERGKELFASLQTARKAFLKSSTRVLELGEQNQNKEAADLLYGEI